MCIDPLGDSAFILSELGVHPYLLADALREAAPEWLLDAYPSYDVVGVFCKEGGTSEELLKDFVLRLVIEESASGRPSKLHVVPVCYEMGEDLQNVASQLEMDTDTVSRMHGSQSYTCYAVGFSPGFPYLGYLPDALRGVPRLAEPRLAVPAGSVAITGKQTAIYPMATPGGWAIIGRTPLEIVNIKDEYFPISAGDEVQFQRIGAAEFEKLRGQRL